jgi:adenylosuccinate lyase
MRRNLDILGGLLLSERIMLALGERIGKQTAHEVVYEIAMTARDSGVEFKEALLADPRVGAHLSREIIEQLLDPTSYIGLAPKLVEMVAGE